MKSNRTEARKGRKEVICPELAILRGLCRLVHMKLVDAPLGLLINFHELRLVDGVRRMILPGADGKPSKGNPTEGSQES